MTLLMMKTVGDPATDERNETQLIWVQNWFEELKRLVTVD